MIDFEDYTVPISCLNTRLLLCLLIDSQMYKYKDFQQGEGSSRCLSIYWGNYHEISLTHLFWQWFPREKCCSVAALGVPRYEVLQHGPDLAINPDNGQHKMWGTIRNYILNPC